MMGALEKMKELIEGRQWQKEDLKLEEITGYTVLRISGTLGGEACVRNQVGIFKDGMQSLYASMTDEDWSVYWYYKCQEQLILDYPRMTKEEIHDIAMDYADDRFLKMKKARRVNGMGTVIQMPGLVFSLADLKDRPSFSRRSFD
jgi:hypothetical protein